MNKFFVRFSVLLLVITSLFVPIFRLFAPGNQKFISMTLLLIVELKETDYVIHYSYCAYGSATELMITYGHGLERFTLDPSIGEFILTAEKMRIPEKSKTIYSINEGNYTTWDANMQRAVDGFKFNTPPYTARYVGSMVADIHRTIMYGGIYLYPADAAKVRKLLFDFGEYFLNHKCK